MKLSISSALIFSAVFLARGVFASASDDDQPAPIGIHKLEDQPNPITKHIYEEPPSRPARRPILEDGTIEFDTFDEFVADDQMLALVPLEVEVAPYGNHENWKRDLKGDEVALDDLSELMGAASDEVGINNVGVTGQAPPEATKTEGAAASVKPDEKTAASAAAAAAADPPAVTETAPPKKPELKPLFEPVYPDLAWNLNSPSKTWLFPETCSIACSSVYVAVPYCWVAGKSQFDTNDPAVIPDPTAHQSSRRGEEIEDPDANPDITGITLDGKVVDLKCICTPDSIFPRFSGACIYCKDEHKDYKDIENMKRIRKYCRENDESRRSGPSTFKKHLFYEPATTYTHNRVVHEATGVSNADVPDWSREKNEVKNQAVGMGGKMGLVAMGAGVVVGGLVLI